MLLSIKTRAQFSTPRQPDAKRRAPRLTFNINPALMFVNNLLANIEAEAAPFARRFRRKKRGSGYIVNDKLKLYVIINHLVIR